MKCICTLLCIVLLTACKAEVPQSHFHANKAIKVSTQTIETSTVIGRINVFGILKSAEEIPLNVDFSAPVKQVLVDEGERVIRGQPLLVFDKRKLDLALQQTQHMLEQSRAQQESTRINFSRLQALIANNTVSQQQFDEAKFARDAADAKIRELKTTLQLIERDLNNTTLLSPIDGIVDKRMVEAGQSTTAYQTLFSLQAAKVVKVSVFVGEYHLPHLRVGNRGKVKTVAGTFKSEIYSISASSDLNTGNFEVKLLLDNSQGRLKPGMSAEVTLLTIPIKDQLIIPESALLAWQGQHVVYLEKNKHAHRQVVKVMPGFDDQLYVTQGLSARDQLIVVGAEQVTDGSLLEISNE